MNSKNRAPVWLAMLTATAVAGLLIVGGCARQEWERPRKRDHPHRRTQRPAH